MVFNAQEFDSDNSMGDKFEDFEVLQLLGEGAFGKVLKVSSLINQKIYAMKILDLKGKENDSMSKEDKEKYFISEIELLKKLDHSNIVKYYKSFRENEQLYIIMEYFDNGDLDDYIRVLKNEKKQKKEEIWNIFYQCMSGLNYLHSMGVIHRDISPQNIFMTKNKIIKIGDFGVSAKFKDKEILKKITSLKDTVVGKAEFMAPEVSNKCYNEKSDIFSMGCVFYKILFLKNYQNETFHFGGNNKNIRKVESGTIPSISDINLKEILTEYPNIKKIYTTGKKAKELYDKYLLPQTGIEAISLPSSSAANASMSLDKLVEAYKVILK
jgi:NIMA (never in mitosis gene a)-related kinase